ncbi:MAG: ABC transporter permease [Planctomycetota bacterium]
MIRSKQFELVRLGISNLLGYPLRTFLTTLGVVFGVGSVIAMLALGAGAERQILEEIGRLGIQNIIINSVKPPETNQGNSQREWISRYGITFKDFEQIKQTVPRLDQVLPIHMSRKQAWWGSKKVEATIYAVEPEYMELFKLDTAVGRNISDLDEESLARVCVIRAGLLKELGIFEDPIGLSLQVGNDQPYEIIGVLEDDEFLGYARQALAVDTKNSEIYVPYETVLRRQGTRSISRTSGSFEATDIELSQVVISVEDLNEVLTVAKMIERVLVRNHDSRDFDVVVPLEVLAQRRKTQQVFNIALVAIASISLLVGGIGIANIMLATVTERTKEIGIRRALGAKRRHIMAQFLTETTTISTLGGLLGILLGLGLVQILMLFTGWTAVVTFNSIALSISISMAVGIISGIFPARRAAQLDPIAALRHE